MDLERWQRVQTVFLAALERDAEARPAFLVAACAGDDALRREVRAMLDAHPDSRALGIEDALGAGDAPDRRADPLLGTHLGPHRLVRHLGRGGMGDVYLAERDDRQYRQRVAIKLVRPGFATPDLAARFRIERQILARLIHPHIAPLLDGGVTDDGRPYLVMHYVEGVSLTTYCNRHRLAVDERLRLFRQVCDAVQLAHTNLIVHRDLKPSNILVTESGEVKLLDFGIAKLLDPAAVDLPVAVTRSEVRVMTPEYAAPEQLRGEAVTTVTDVYALGLLLYELLTDHRPHRLASRTPAEIERMVCHTAPRRPSTAITESAAAGHGDGTTETRSPDQVSAARRISVGRLRKLLRGDLDNIVMMALRKEPGRRYASAEALSEDVLRYLTGRPVAARPDTVGYRLRKFVQRNRLAVGAGALVALLVLGFGVAMAVQAARIAQHARDLEAERDRVRQQVEKTSRVKTLVSDLFKAIDTNEDPSAAAERLQAAARRLVEGLEGQGELQAELMDEVVTIYINLGLFEAAQEMAEASLAARRSSYEAGDPAIALGLHRLGETLFLNSRFEEAEGAYRQALDLQRSALGDTDAAVARSLVHLSRLYRNMGRYPQAEASATEAHGIYQAAYGDADARTALALSHLARARGRRHGPEAAEPLLREVLAVQRSVLGSDHPELARTLVTLARALEDQRRFDDAEPLFYQALAIQRERFGDHHPDATRTLNLIGGLHLDRQEYDRAEAAFRQALASRRLRHGDRHASTGANMILVAQVLTRKGDFAEAEALLLEALPIRQASFGIGHWLIHGELQALVDLYQAWGRPQEAARYRRMQDDVRRQLDGDASAADGS